MKGVPSQIDFPTQTAILHEIQCVNNALQGIKEDTSQIKHESITTSSRVKQMGIQQTKSTTNVARWASVAAVSQVQQRNPSSAATPPSICLASTTDSSDSCSKREAEVLVKILATTVQQRLYNLATKQHNDLKSYIQGLIRNSTVERVRNIKLALIKMLPSKDLRTTTFNEDDARYLMQEGE